MDYDTIRRDKKLRKIAGERNLLAFAFLYFNDFITFNFAPFHRDLEYDLLDDETQRILVLMFRESAKTVLCGLIYPLWCICYKKRNFIIYGSDESNAAAANMANLIFQLQTNTLLKNDFGELYFESKGAGKATRKKTIKDFTTTNNIRVLARGVGQKVRGSLHNSHRPDLFIGDDLESLRNVGTKENRDKIDNWIHSEVLSAMDQATGKAIILGNLLHQDAVVNRIAKKTEVWSVHKVPLIVDGQFAWPQRWVHTKSEADKINATRPRERWVVSKEQVEYDKGNLVFNQEYMLRPISDKDQIIKGEWIQYFDLHKKNFDLHDEKRYRVGMALDPAISEKEKADFTACTVWIYERATGFSYCLDHFNIKASFEDIKQKTNKFYRYYYPHFLKVEDVAAQNWLIQDLTNNFGLPVFPVKRRSDKRSRLITVSSFFQQGRVFFQRHHETIIDQLVNFGATEHDDLVDTVIDTLQEFYNVSGTRVFKNNTGL